MTPIKLLEESEIFTKSDYKYLQEINGSFLFCKTHYDNRSI